MNDHKIILPKKISKGAKFGFFSPSDPIYPRRIEFIKLGVKIINDWGFQTEVISDSQLSEWAVYRNPQMRADEFHLKLKDPTIDGLIATWGGKNSNDLLPLIDYSLVRKFKKPIVGSSDIAVILNAITWKTDLVTFYGPNVLGKFNQTKEYGFPFLIKNTYKNIPLFPNEYNAKFKVLRKGKVEGILIGGSLGTFTLGLSGTSYMPQFKNMIFFFESSSLDYFRIRQHIQNLKINNFLKNVSGLIVGVTEHITNETRNQFENMLLEFFPGEIPIILCNYFGHGFYYNSTFPIGSKLKIDTNQKIFEIDSWD